MQAFSIRLSLIIFGFFSILALILSTQNITLAQDSATIANEMGSTRTNTIKQVSTVNSTSFLDQAAQALSIPQGIAALITASGALLAAGIALFSNWLVRRRQEYFEFSKYQNPFLYPTEAVYYSCIPQYSNYEKEHSKQKCNYFD
ncbi:MAG TPA: hypothetical protein VKA95_00865 [Nitrososphaeraceae archaeon]|nr:hypothetical protein [Nitrososphaeraceae archaeon]